MKRQPTIEEAKRIHQIVVEVSATVTYQPEHFSWGPHKKEAFDLIRTLGGKPPNKSCFACWVKGLDFLRQAVNLEAMGRSVSLDKQQSRMDKCQACPAYQRKTESCGRLILDFLSPRPVPLIDGGHIIPCGCYLPAKTSLKHASCPAKKW